MTFSTVILSNYKGDFGDISIYSKENGYLGGMNLFRFAEKCNLPYDNIVIGGSAGIILAYNIARNNPEENINFEKNEHTLQDYKDDEYDNLFKWNLAQEIKISIFFCFWQQ